MVWKIAKIGTDDVIRFAADELKKYMCRMDPSQEYVVMLFEKFDPALEDVLWVGEDVSFELPAVEDKRYDDGVSIEVHGHKGYITGTNPRSVLIGAYRFLRELGCAFIRPGENGEVIPHRTLREVEVSVFEKASYRHRAVCIEGADAAEHVLNMIDWLPKVGMNGYFNQFQIPYTFYERWYTHQGNPLHTPEPFGVKDAEGIRNQSIYEAKKRGLLYHAAGHGWTCEPFGMEGNGWYAKEYDIPEAVRPYLAQVNGKRELWGGVPLNTNLCYSSEYVRDTMANAVADYLEAVPEVDYLHVWLADDTNNHCECDRCRDRRPADLYVELLNHIDRVLSERGIDRKIVFLIYVDLLWEPLEARIENPDRFVMMFAPITRTYSETMTGAGEFDAAKLSPYKKNQVSFPKDVSENIARLRRWQEQFQGDSFVFDYHFMWDHYKDPGYFKMAKVLFDDMKYLDRLGLNGMVSCQVQRAFFPTGLGMTAMAAALWDQNLEFDAVAGNYFRDSFGSGGEAVRDYMSTLSELFDPPYLRGERQVVSEESAERFERIPRMIDEFAPVIAQKAQGMGGEKLAPAQRISWETLVYHGELLKLTARGLACAAQGEFAMANEAKEAAMAYARFHEDRLKEVFDVYEFTGTLKGIFADLERRSKEK